MSSPQLFRNKQDLIKKLIDPSDTVLDVGFWGQGVSRDMPHWPHRLIKERAREVYGVDIAIDDAALDPEKYHKESAEDFNFPKKFDVIFAGDIIEHLPNPGRFLAACARHMDAGSRLIITTPNTFNLFSMASKVLHPEPPVNRDHVAYYNRSTLKQLFTKCGLAVESFHWTYASDVVHAESWKKKFLNVVYVILAQFTLKYADGLVVIARLPSS